MTVAFAGRGSRPGGASVAGRPRTAVRHSPLLLGAHGGAVTAVLLVAAVLLARRRRQGRVRISQPSAVTTSVCSNWAERLRSLVTTVQPSGQMS